MSPTFAIVTLGCKVNQYESQALREGFRRSGLMETDPLDSPDIFMLNSCGVTARNSAHSRWWINRVRRKSPGTAILATGCCADIEPEAVAGADLVVPQVRKHLLADAAAGAVRAENVVARLAGALEDSSGGNGKSNIDIEIHTFSGHTRGFLKVQDGCSGGCSYCAVPLARGRSVSKPIRAVIDEAAGLARAGHPEIVLCGVNLGHYGRDIGIDDGLARLLDALLETPGPARFRLSSIEATDVSDTLLEIMASTSRICSHLHIPLQSGDPSVLKAMRRNYTAEDFIETVRRARDILDEPGITTDCMAAFPGETDQNFENTLAVCRECAFSRIHVFPFSPRPRTAAARLPGRLPERTGKRRVRVLIEEAHVLGRSYLDRLTGNCSVSATPCLDVIIEKVPVDDMQRPRLFKGVPGGISRANPPQSPFTKGGRMSEGRPSVGRMSEGRPSVGRMSEGRPSVGRTSEGRPCERVLEKGGGGHSLGLAARYVRVRVRGSYPTGARVRGVPVGHDDKYIDMEVCDD